MQMAATTSATCPAARTRSLCRGTMFAAVRSAAGLRAGQGLFISARGYSRSGPESTSHFRAGASSWAGLPMNWAEPIAGARMQAWRDPYLPSGQRRLTPTSGGPLGAMLTNDLGAFLFGSMPGAYVVSADPRRPEPDGYCADSQSGRLRRDVLPRHLSTRRSQPVTVGIGEEAMAGRSPSFPGRI